MGRIHLIRHGLTEANKERKYYGASDVPLANEGVDIITKLAMAKIYPEAEGADLYTTGLIRTEQTFFLIYGDIEHQKISELREYNFGDFEMKTHNELQNYIDYLAWIYDEKGITRCPNGECRTDFWGRVNAGFGKIVENHKVEAPQERKSIVVCHGGVISVIMRKCFPEVEKNIFEWTPDPGRGYTIYLENGEAVSYDDI